jgi:hypothetical protein
MMRFEVLTEVKLSMLVFWVVTPCGLVGRYQRFGRTYCLNLQPRRPTQTCLLVYLTAFFSYIRHTGYLSDSGHMTMRAGVLKKSRKRDVGKMIRGEETKRKRGRR